LEFFLAIARDTGISLHYLMIILAQEGSSEPRPSEYTKTICSGLHMKQRKKTILLTRFIVNFWTVTLEIPPVRIAVLKFNRKQRKFQ
jgi:hypothetical protein